MAAPPVVDEGPRSVLLHLAENTTLHGVPNAYRAHSWVRKAVWAALCLAGLGLCLYQVISNFQKYYSYPTTSTSAFVSDYERMFPAVTFCNINPVRVSMMNQSVLDELSDDNDYWDNYDLFQNWYAPLSQEVKSEMGHKLDHMLLSCEYAGDSCSKANFTDIFNGMFGNCYTFNVGGESETLVASSVGPKGGLMLELYIEQDEYLPILSDIVGLRLLVHNQTYMPLPEKEGVNLAPGFASSIAITRMEIRRAPPPYGACAEISSQQNTELNVYSNYFEHVGYSYQACRFTCYQQNVIDNCGCGDAAYPLGGRPLPDGQDAITCTSLGRQECVGDQNRKFNSESDNCTDACPIMCLEILYEQQFSFGLWPSEVGLEKIYKKIDKNLAEDDLNGVLENATTADEQFAWIRKNVVKVMVYFERLDYNTHTTKGYYSVINLLSDQGGQVGLWLGLSILTLFEMVELLWDLTISVYRRAKSRSATSSTEIDSFSTEKPTTKA